MKMDRLLGIVVYLLNRETVSARELAEKFEVSPRTIQRDMASISLAGIPVGSQQGLNGGYYIIDSYKMNRQLLQSEDYTYILAALKGLLSGYDSLRAQSTVEIMTSLAPDKAALGPMLQLNLGVLREGEGTGGNIALVEKAIREKIWLGFQYTDARGGVTDRGVEPLLLTYKWYAWYLFAYCCDKQDYRLFRLSRMRSVHLMSQTFTLTHKDAELLLSEHSDLRPQTKVRLACMAEHKVLLQEAFPQAELLEEREGELLMSFTVPEEEQGWFGKLLEYSQRITVLEPEELRLRMHTQAAFILEKYR
ncbi:helix-turn-helix transcriptional regulator [Paenibacillus riograndensis]|uniref:HTH deoR-type domain-containing protein n=1 Tax=Paenibacillus riograndensis SBR5 TaxID=1073571 RepID=A0A0E3WH81_9BACL|nr:YafY family protein [Paenibacillus riograndensis]CQR54828.1 hypothetical protein PRIO_2422 [Paenibacillus riograndensis SBR5]